MRFELKEKGLVGKIKSANSVIDKTQKYNGIAIRSAKKNLEQMQAVARANLFHVASNKENNFHFLHCLTEQRVHANTVRIEQLMVPKLTRMYFRTRRFYTCFQFEF